MTEHERNRTTRRQLKPAAGKPASHEETPAPSEKPFDPSKFGATTIPHALRLELLQMKRPTATKSRLYGYGILPPSAQRQTDAASIQPEVTSADEQRSTENHVDTLTGLPAPHANAQPELACGPAETESPVSSVQSQPAPARRTRLHRLSVAAQILLGSGVIISWLLLPRSPISKPAPTISAAKLPVAVRSQATAPPPSAAVTTTSASVTAPTVPALHPSAPAAELIQRTHREHPASASHVNQSKPKNANSAPDSVPAANSSQPVQTDSESKSWIQVRD